jgi:DNA-binding TFAR19-related protein (PDSD5 family)
MKRKQIHMSIREDYIEYAIRNHVRMSSLLEQALYKLKRTNEVGEKMSDEEMDMLMMKIDKAIKKNKM